MLQSILELGTLDALLLVTTLILLMAYELISGMTLQGMSRLRTALRILLIPMLMILGAVIAIHVVSLF